MEISEAQTKISNIRIKLAHANQPWPLLILFTDLMEEMGELAEIIKAKEGYKPYKNLPLENMGKEIADVLFSLFSIANYYEIDIEKSLMKILAEYEDRFLR
jgi:NTP pyrophosphatase (non-canonical NTP hydrolase)